MNHPDHEILAALKTLRYDLTALQAKLSDLLTLAARLPTPDPPDSVECPNCQLAFESERRLAEHAYNVHHGPEPEHWNDEQRPDGRDTQARAKAAR